MITISKTAQFALLALALFATAFAFVLFQQPQQVNGSVSDSSEYVATTTAFSNIYGSTANASKLIASSSLTLGSVVITGATTGVWNIYDATTSDVTKRAQASSSILIASFPASIAAGTYTFDVKLNNGLYVDLISGTLPTTTITWRR